MTNYVLVLAHLYPNSQYSILDNEYSTLDWQSETPKPTQLELDQAWVQVQMAIEHDRISAIRQLQYQRESDPIFFKWQRGDATEQDWLDAVQQIKTNNPYPEE